MQTADFDYDLPVEYIAQTPIEPRDHSRLLVLDRSNGEVEHSRFFELERFVSPGDLLVLNETRVIPARLYAHKLPGGGRVELLLLRRQDDCTWEALVGGKRLDEGRRVEVEGGPGATVMQSLEGSLRLIRFDEPIDDFLGKAGRAPLPPYIHTPLPDPERYQTVYARTPGSAAAPTAGLHFTPELIARLQAAGTSFVYVTLHVGLDTFAPVTETVAEHHQIHSEWCELTEYAAEKIRAAHRSGGRIIAVGTTSVRTLESAARAAPSGQLVTSYRGSTDLFILPGYCFRVVDALITNFHLPHSTLIMLVSAFAGRENVLAAYEVAKQQGYRFFSFGDAMFIR